MSNPGTERFLRCWLEQAASVLSQSSGAKWTAAIGGVEGAQDGAVAVVFACGGSLRGEIALRATPADALLLAQALVGDDGATEFTTDHREALDELFRQIAGLVATSVKPELGAVELTLRADAPSTNAAATEVIRLESDGHAVTLGVAFSQELCEALRPRVESPTARVEEIKKRDDGNLELLLDVELGATLRFGQRKLLLREILELSSGSVVELDRQVQEPVELLVDDHLVARGEVVIVGGNYGIRVTEVASTMQRVAAI